MRWKTPGPIRPRSLCQSVEIAADRAEVFAHWTRFEHFPEFMQSVQRAKRISDRRVLWDVVIAGHQLVWEARIVDLVPDTCIRWESRRKPRMTGEVRFEQIGPRRTRLTAEIDYRPDSLLERMGSRLGWVDDCVRRELAAFRDHVQSHANVSRNHANVITRRSAGEWITAT